MKRRRRRRRRRKRAAAAKKDTATNAKPHHHHHHHLVATRKNHPHLPKGNHTLKKKTATKTKAGPPSDNSNTPPYAVPTKKSPWPSMCMIC
jgi:hypothetical protein